MPDATNPVPTSDGPPGQTSSPSSNFDLSALAPGQYVSLGDLNGLPAYVYRANDGNLWYVVSDGTEAGQVQATFFGGSANGLADILPLAQVQDGYGLDAAKWTMAYDPSVGTWTVYEPGTTFDGVVAGYASDGWNVVMPNGYASTNAAVPPMVPVIPDLPRLPQPPAGPVMPQMPVGPVPPPAAPQNPGERPRMPDKPIIVPPMPGGPTVPQGPVVPPAPGGQPPAPNGPFLPPIPPWPFPQPPGGNGPGNPGQPPTIIVRYFLMQGADGNWYAVGGDWRFDTPPRIPELAPMPRPVPAPVGPPGPGEPGHGRTT